MIVSNTQSAYPIGSAKTNEQDKKQTTSNDIIKRYDTFEKQGEITKSGVYEPPKKLTAEQVEEIKRAQEESLLKLVNDTILKTSQIQADSANSFYTSLGFSDESQGLLTDIFGSMENAFPTPATTPEGALADISEGGAYSVEAVSERIMKMATTIAGDDPEMLATMEQAVKDGFAAAGLNLETGEGMPGITFDTYNHIMGEFEKLRGE